MLEPGNTYRRNDGRLVAIAGKVKPYTAETPWLWSLSGDWYDENTGGFSTFLRGKRVTLASDASRSIGNHTPVNTEKETDTPSLSKKAAEVSPSATSTLP